MTAREKAEELIKKFEKGFQTDGDSCVGIMLGREPAKNHALIAVEELINSHLVLTTTHDREPSIRCKRYWQEVKQWIEKV